jgi:hypothetical protein
VSVYEFEYNNMMCGDELPVTDLYVTGIVGDDCGRFGGTEYLVWVIMVHNNYMNSEEVPGYSVVVIPAAEDMSTEYDVPYHQYSGFEGTEGLANARRKAIELLQLAYEGELDR